MCNCGSRIWYPWVLCCRSNLWMTAKALLALTFNKSTWYRATPEYFEPTLLFNPFLKLTTFFFLLPKAFILFYFIFVFVFAF